MKKIIKPTLILTAFLIMGATLHSYQLVSASAYLKVPEKIIASSNSYQVEMPKALNFETAAVETKNSKYKNIAKVTFSDKEYLEEKTVSGTVELFVNSTVKNSNRLLMNIIHLIGKKKITANQIKVRFIHFQDEKGKWYSPYGEQSLLEDLNSIAIARYWPEKLFAYLQLRLDNEDDENYDYYLLKAGINPLVLKSVLKDNKESLLAQNGQLVKKAKIKEGPVVMHDQVKVAGGQIYLAELEDILLNGKRREVYPVEVVILSAKVPGLARQIELYKKVLAERIAEISFQEIDYKTAKGKKIMDYYKIAKLPAYLLAFNSNDELFQKLRKNGFLEKEILLEERKFYLVAPDSTDTTYYFTRPKIENRLDIFVMSQCPYGVAAGNALADILSKNKALKWQFHYLIYQDNKGEFQSLHGQGELEENIRQLFVLKKHPEKFLRYLNLRNKDIYSSYWQLPLEELKINVAELLKFAGDRETVRKILAENYEFAGELQIEASPTFLWQNQLVLTSETIREIPAFQNVKIEAGSCD